ncbi:MAG: nucleotidyltransferase [Elusimicrobia bacterium]|nr:nucleotidyltransferase [Elusimicrobiota bacterium]
MTNMPYTDRYLEFLKALDKHKVDYLIIGAYATMIHTKVARATKDMDTWIRQTGDNAKRLTSALKEFAGREIPAEAILKRNQRIEIKGEMFKIEIWTSQEVITFEQAWEKRKVESVGGITFNVISKEDLIKLKRHFNRPQDKMDLSLLETKLDRGLETPHRNRRVFCKKSNV